MCGIIGVFPVPAVIRQLGISREAIESAIRILTSQLLVSIEDRGKDATGLFVLFEDKEWAVLKQPVAASDFIINSGQTRYATQKQNASYAEVMRGWHYRACHSSPTSLVLGHARKGTKGSEYKDANNHPIIVENQIFGVHNGKINNDDRIFAVHPELKRAGEVDSEALFQLIYAVAPDEPPSLPLLKELDTRLRGEYAFMFSNKAFPGIVGGIRRDRTIEVALCPQLGVIILASEKQALEKSFLQYNRTVVALGLSKTLPTVTSIDIKWEYMADGTAFCFNLLEDTKTLDSCYHKSSLPTKREADNKTYDIGGSSGGSSSSSSYGSSSGSSSYGSSSGSSSYSSSSSYDYGPGRKSVFVDMTDYVIENTGIEGTSKEVPLEELSSIQVLGAVDDEVFDHLREHAVDLLASDTVPEKSQWVSALTKENLYNELGIPETSEVIDELVLINIVALVHERSFADGYAYAVQQGIRLEARSDAAISENSSDVENPPNVQALLRKRRRTSAFIANLKTFALAALAAGENLGFDPKIGVWFSQEVLDVAKAVDNRFDSDQALSAFGQQGDADAIGRAMKAAQQEGLVDSPDEENEDEDEAAVEETDQTGVSEEAGLEGTATA